MPDDVKWQNEVEGKTISLAVPGHPKDLGRYGRISEKGISIDGKRRKY